MDLRFYKSPGETWAAMLADCRAARKSIEMEQYIVADDPIGREFLEMFLQKCRQGVSVRLLLDRIGSRAIYDSDMIRRIVDAGGQVRFYNPLNFLRIFTPPRWFPRNHTKTVLIDSEIAWIGGVCLEHAMRDWRDTMVRFTGPLVDQVEIGFARERINWRARMKDLRRRDVESHLPFEYVVHRPHLGPNPIYRRLVRAIHQAKSSVCLVSPYFLPPFGLRRAIRQAARRGVRVQVMMSEKTDAPLADAVSRSYFSWLHRKGIGIFLYKKCMLHAKYAIVDGEWATIGSTNFDYLSLKRNREANIVTRDAHTISTLQSHFDEDMAHCIEVTCDYWRSLPLYQRVIGYLGRSVKKLL